MVDLVIRGGRLVDVRARTAEPADVLIEGDTIAEIARPGGAAPADARSVDARGKLLIPGLINAHTHGHSNLAKGMMDRYDLQLLLNAAAWFSGKRTAEDKYLSTLIGAVEMVKKGVTAAYDLSFELPSPSVEGLEAVARAYADVGMRAAVAPMMGDRTFYHAHPGLLEGLPADLRARVEGVTAAPYTAMLETCREALRSWKHDRERVRPALAPTIPLHCSDPFMVGCRDLAREFGVGIHMHVAESRLQAISGVRRYGQTLVGHLDALGLVGPQFTAAHAIWLDRDDMARLGERGASAAHNPGSNMRLGSGLAAVRAMRAHGVNVAIGTDGTSCSDNQNVFEAMRLASFVSRVQGTPPERWLSAPDVLTMATEGGARALGFEKIGRVAAGYRADLVFLDAAHPNYVPLNDAVNQVVYAEDGTGVHSVMIGGRLVVDAGRVTTLDVSTLAARAQAAVERLRTANEPARRLVEALEPVLGAVCGTLMSQPYHVERHATQAGLS
jgi:guanine deaminase